MTRPHITVREATAHDLQEYYGWLPAENTRSMVACVDGRPAAVIGIAISGGTATLFSDTKPVIEPYLRTFCILRTVRTVLDMAKSCGLPVLAWVCREPGARILAREGFRLDSKPGWWRWEA